MSSNPSGRRAPGSFSPIPILSGSSSSHLELPPRSDSIADPEADALSLRPPSSRRPPLLPSQTLPPLNTNTQNFSRPTGPRSGDGSVTSASPWGLSASTSNPSALDAHSPHTRGHARKHSNSAGFFEPTLPSALSSTLSLASVSGGTMAGLTTSQIAAQAAMQQPHGQQQQHLRQRSQTIPIPPDHAHYTGRKPSRGPASPPILSLTEASQPQGGGFAGQSYNNGLLGTRHQAATTAANVVFARSPSSSPGLPAQDVPVVPEKPSKSEKSKVKLFSRPSKIGIGKDVKDKAQPSPNKLGSFANFQLNNASMHSLVEVPTASSMYSLGNSSAATIRPVDSYSSQTDLSLTKESSKGKEKQHRHHFLSRQKHKLSNKDDHSLKLSSAASNSLPSDPNAPSTLYNFNVPASPAAGATSFTKSMSGLDLRHGGRALREKKREAASGDRDREHDLGYMNSEWAGPSSVSSAGGYFGPPSAGFAPSIYGSEVQDLAKYGLNNMTVDDAWPYLRAKLLIVFEGDELRLPVEDFNRLVTMHLRTCIQKRSPGTVVEDFRDFLSTGFGSLDQALRQTPDDRLVPQLIQMWILAYSKILPYIQAVFLPLDLEFAGQGPLMSTETAREFWAPILSSREHASTYGTSFDVRKMVLLAYRDALITPRYDTLKAVFSRLSLESINGGFGVQPILSTSPDSFPRPGTAASLDPSHGSYNSQTTTLLGSGSGGADTPLGARSRAISNVSFGSTDSNAIPSRPFTPSATHPHLAAVWSLQNDQRDREANVEDSKFVTEMVGRMLQCMSVLASVGGAVEDERQRKMEELCRALKLNWLGRGRTGRNRRGIVPPKMHPPTAAVSG